MRLLTIYWNFPHLSEWDLQARAWCTPRHQDQSGRVSCKHLWLTYYLADRSRVNSDWLLVTKFFERLGIWIEFEIVKLPPSFVDPRKPRPRIQTKARPFWILWHELQIWFIQVLDSRRGWQGIPQSLITASSLSSSWYGRLPLFCWGW